MKEEGGRTDLVKIGASRTALRYINEQRRCFHSGLVSPRATNVDMHSLRRRSPQGQRRRIYSTESMAVRRENMYPTIVHLELTFHFLSLL